MRQCPLEVGDGIANGEHSQGVMSGADAKMPAAFREPGGIGVPRQLGRGHPSRLETFQCPPVKNPTASFEEVREVTEAEGSRQSSLLLQRVAYLADIGSMSPMLGLLGTVIGLITSFNHMSQVGVSGNQHMNVASGVYEALFNTAAGLGIGIPSLMVYSVYRGKVQRLISELEAASTHLMALLAAQYKRAARAAASRSGGGSGHSDSAH